MTRKRRQKKNMYSQAKPIGLGVILLIAVVAIVSSFHPKIESMPITVAENILAPHIDLVVRNKTNQRIEAQHNNETIAHISPSRQITTPMFDGDTQADEDCQDQDWEASELYKFYASGNRHISLNPSLFVSGGTLILSHPCYVNLRSASLEGGQEVEPGKEYRLIFTIQGNRFQESFVTLEECHQ